MNQNLITVERFAHSSDPRSYAVGSPRANWSWMREQRKIGSENPHDDKKRVRFTYPGARLGLGE